MRAAARLAAVAMAGLLQDSPPAAAVAKAPGPAGPAEAGASTPQELQQQGEVEDVVEAVLEICETCVNAAGELGLGDPQRDKVGFSN